MNVKVKFKRALGKCIMSIDATELHEYLTLLGVPRDESGAFADRPRTSYTTVNTSDTRVSTAALLGASAVCDVALSGPGAPYTQPVSIEVLNELSTSFGDVVREIVDHYRPIEISVIVAGKRAA